jgi:3D (Asp-Asp-Asp) domain-containing protein
LIFPAKTSSAETLSSVALDIPSIPSKGTLGEKIAVEENYVVPPKSYVATAYSLRGRTASGRMVSKGLIAADPRHLPLGSRVRIDAGAYSGEYVVADTGGMVRGRRIDIWTPTSREAMRFGRRVVKLTVLSLGRKK